MDSIREGKHEDFTAKRLWELNQHIMGKDAGLLVVFTAFEEKNLQNSLLSLLKFSQILRKLTIDFISLLWQVRKSKSSLLISQSRKIRMKTKLA